ncbi:helix-turn-helix transcriptional regulator [Bacillus sp. BAU-SS-2023]|nr:helix-turn-helix transcriptional regulator [Bacillus sp. BAU-SS-2023]
MEIGNKLKKSRLESKLTQEKVAEEIQVSRQTISNWENEKSYPDIISVIKLSDLYNVSLDELLKGDSEMIKYLEESTNIVSSNKKLLIAFGINIIFFILFIFFNGVISSNNYLIIGSASIGILSISALFYQIIKKF